MIVIMIVIIAVIVIIIIAVIIIVIIIAAVTIGASVNDDEPFVGDRLVEAETGQCLILLPSSGDGNDMHHDDDEDNDDDEVDDNDDDDDDVYQVHAVQAERMRARSDWFLSDPSGLVINKII